MERSPDLVAVEQTAEALRQASVYVREVSGRAGLSPLMRHTLANVVNLLGTQIADAHTLRSLLAPEEA